MRIFLFLAILGFQIQAHAAGNEINCRIKQKADNSVTESEIIRPIGGDPRVTNISILTETPKMYLFGIPADGNLTKSSIMRWGSDEFFSVTGDISQSPLNFSDNSVSISCWY